MNVASVKETLSGRRTKPATAAPPASDASIADARTHLKERQSALNALQSELNAVELQIAEIGAAKILGEPIDARALVALGEQRDTVHARITDEQSLVAGLQARITAFDALAARREYDQLIADMAAISAAAPERERQYEEHLAALVKTAGAMAADGHRFDVMRARARRLQERHRFTSTRTRRPHAAVIIDPRYLQFAESVVGDFQHYWMHRVANLHDWAGRERPVEDESKKPWQHRRTDGDGESLFRALRNLETKGGDMRPGVTTLALARGAVIALRHDVARWIERNHPGTLEPTEQGGK